MFLAPVLSAQLRTQPTGQASETRNLDPPVAPAEEQERQRKKREDEHSMCGDRNAVVGMTQMDNSLTFLGRHYALLMSLRKKAKQHNDSK
jgi:hypothetical protein